MSTMRDARDVAAALSRACGRTLGKAAAGGSQRKREDLRELENALAEVAEAAARRDGRDDEPADARELPRALQVDARLPRGFHAASPYEV